METMNFTAFYKCAQGEVNPDDYPSPNCPWGPHLPLKNLEETFDSIDFRADSLLCSLILNWKFGSKSVSHSKWAIWFTNFGKKMTIESVKISVINKNCEWIIMNMWKYFRFTRQRSQFKNVWFLFLLQCKIQFQWHENCKRTHTLYNDRKCAFNHGENCISRRHKTDINPIKRMQLARSSFTWFTSWLSNSSPATTIKSTNVGCYVHVQLQCKYIECIMVVCRACNQCYCNQ